MLEETISVTLPASSDSVLSFLGVSKRREFENAVDLSTSGSDDEVSPPPDRKQQQMLLSKVCSRRLQQNVAYVSFKPCSVCFQSACDACILGRGQWNFMFQTAATPTRALLMLHGLLK